MSYDRRLGSIREATGSIFELVGDYEIGGTLPLGFERTLSTLEALIQKVRRDHPSIRREKTIFDSQRDEKETLENP